MEKFNRYWALKYSEHREQLKDAINSIGCSIPSGSVPEDFSPAVVYEVSYPSSFKGPQTRFVGKSVCFDTFPTGVVIKRLSSSEIKRLYLYYQLNKFICHV